MAEGDELHKGIIRLGGKPFRRIKKHVGETWKPDTSNSPNINLGPWCPNCRTIHGWRSVKTLATKYEKRGGVWFIMWICKKSGDVIKEQGLVQGRKK